MTVPQRLLDPALPTPLLVYSEAELENAWRRLSKSRAKKILFAVKSCYRPPVLRALRRLGAGAEVMTELEYELVLAAGFEPEQILVNGLGRSSEFLDRVVTDGCRLVLDSLLEFERVQQLGKPARLGIRLATSVGRGGYAGGSKLGLQPDSQAWKTIVEGCRQNPDLRLDMLHLHLASQETNADLFLEVLKQLPEGFSIIDLGGGFETATEVPAAEFERLGTAFRERFPDTELWLEPGRALVNGAGFVLTTVLAHKESGGRHYLVIDAPSSTLMPHRETTYRLLHPEPGQNFTADLVDGITSLTSTVKAGVGFAQVPQVGQRLLLGNCGAYTHAMSQFWAFPPLPVSFLDIEGRLHTDLSKEAIAEAGRLLLGGAMKSGL